VAKLPELSGDGGRGSGFHLNRDAGPQGNGGGFKTLERWLASCDALFLKRDREDFLVVLAWRVYQQLLQRK
jgi:hypothetical protein